MTDNKRHRQPKNSDKALSITLTLKVSDLQYKLIQDIKPANQSIGEWLRLAAVSMAYHERNRIALEAAAGTSGAATVQDIEGQVCHASIRLPRG